MKNNKFFTMNKKTIFTKSVFHEYRYSAIIGICIIAAVVMIFSTGNYFKEGIYATQVAYTNQNTDQASIATFNPYDIGYLPEKQLRTKAVQENDKVEVAFARTTPVKMQDSINQNVADSVVSEQKKVIEKKVVHTKKEKKDQEVFKASNSMKIKLSSKDRSVLERIVEAEATGEDIKGKMLVANVVLNRVQSSGFPNTVEKVVFQRSQSVYQFSPIKDGRYYRVAVSQDTKKAIKRVLNGEDYSCGALFFMSRNKAVSRSVTWFDSKLSKVFQYGTHEFYK